MKITRRTKLLVVALALCFTTMIGSTFAWFTDSVESNGNIITTGNLEVAMHWANGTTAPDTATWTDASAGAIFNYTNWEPGYVEVRHVKISNTGSLALKYDLKLVPTGEVSDLADVIDVYYFDPAQQLTSRTQLTSDKKIGTLADFIKTNDTSDNTAAGVLKAGESHTVTIALMMQTTAGNDYQNLSIGTDFKLVLNATQATVESDSFGSDYDAGAQNPVGTILVSTFEELKAAFATGGKIRLMASFTVEEVLYVKSDVAVELDMNGNTLTATDSKADPVFYTYEDSTLTITGNGTVKMEAPFFSLMFPGGDVIIENGTFVRTVPEGTPVKQVGNFFVGAKVSPWGSQTVTINGGYFDGGYYDENAADIDEILAGTKVFVETEDDIAKRGNSKDANAVRVALKNNIQLLLNLSSNRFDVKGGTFVGMNPAWGDEGCMLPTTPNYLRPWSYYQGALIKGQEFNENGIVLPEGYTITKGTLEDGRPTYTVQYTKPQP